MDIWQYPEKFEKLVMSLRTAQANELL